MMYLLIIGGAFMIFTDIILWVCAILFLVGLVFVFEKLLSSIFGFILMFLSCLCFTFYFWIEGLLIFSILFGVVLLLAVRFGIGSFK